MLSRNNGSFCGKLEASLGHLYLEGLKANSSCQAYFFSKMFRTLAFREKEKITPFVKDMDKLTNSRKQDE